MTAVALTIAGSDSGGGAGIQADLKTFSALGVYGASAITALTAQNTRGVSGVLGIEPAFVRAQIDAVMEDLAVDAVKVGMLGSAAVTREVAAALRAWKPRWIVVDPVMVAKGGDKLLNDDAVQVLRDEILPLASLITPNLPEAGVLLDASPVSQRREMPPAAARLQGLGVANVLLKGGHLENADSPDVLMHGGELIWLEGRRTATQNTHGTGCTLSSAITALLARGLPLPQAAAEAKAWLGQAIEAADTLAVGHGHGPVHHFHHWWSRGG